MTAPDNQPESSKQAPAPIVPVIKELQPRSAIPTEVTQVIASVPPQEALDRIDGWVQLEYGDRDKERAHQLQLARIQQETEQLKETNRVAERKADRASLQTNVRWGFGIFLVIFLAALGYGYARNDNEMPKTIITVGAGVLGGAGVKEMISKTKTEQGTDKK